jgi:cytochrome b6-f complex iron-sulfur subunit
MTGRALRRYVEDLLHGRRPRGFAATEDDVAPLRTAITLRAARPGDDAPRAEFVDALEQRLAAKLADPPQLDPARLDHPPHDSPQRSAAPWGLGRRGVLVGGAAVAAAVGVLVDRTLLTGGVDGADQTTDTLTPTSGGWQTVVASDQLPEGAVRAFDLGAVVGFVARTDGVVAAVSGTCTHQGCRLQLNAPSRQLDCPCHMTVFALDGELVAHQLPAPPGPLPHIATREVDGAVQVYSV